jgi:hypothetical protein
MALPPPAAAVIFNGPMNPIEAAFSTLNTNTYFIGLMMLVLNLGGRHLATSLTVEQDRFLQNPWFRRILLFVVIFVATRNVFTAFWMSISVIILLAYLTNESSRLYIFGKAKPATVEPVPEGLNAEENDIFKKLQDKVKRHQDHVKQTEKPVAPQPSYQELFTNSYISAMSTVKAAV